MRHYLWTLVGLSLAVSPLDAQGLRDKISQLFIFADGKDPLFLSGTAGSDSATAVHADHFVPSAVNDNGTLISFIGTAISQNVANLAVSATSGGSTFRFEGGVAVPTSGSWPGWTSGSCSRSCPPHSAARATRRSFHSGAPPLNTSSVAHPPTRNCPPPASWKDPPRGSGTSPRASRSTLRSRTAPRSPS